MKQTIIAATIVLSMPLGAGASETGRGGRFVGTWINEVKIVSCQQPQTVLATLLSMTSYLPDGTVIEGGSAATPPPAVSRSAGHGVWERAGHHSIEVQFRSHSLDALGRLVRISEVSSRPTLVWGDNPNTPDVVEPYYLAGWGTNRITNLDPVTGAVLSVTQGCNYAASRPLTFAP